MNEINEINFSFFSAALSADRQAWLFLVLFVLRQKVQKIAILLFVSQKQHSLLSFVS